MNISTFLQSIITVVFIYLLLSLIASEIQENISAVFELRARRLKQSIQKMLGETNYDHRLTDKIYEHPSILTLNQSASSLTSLVLGISFNFLTWDEWRKDWQNIFSSITWIIFFASILFQWPIWLKIILFSLVIICRLCFLFFLKSEDREISRKSIGPSYIEPETIAQAIISVIKDGQSISTDSIADKPSKYLDNLTEDFNLSSKKLSQIVSFDNDDWSEFQKTIEDLYKKVQERSSGVYKRNAKGLSLILGMIIAIISNADIFNIIQVLNKSNKDYTSQLVGKLEKEGAFSKVMIKDPTSKNPGNELDSSQKEKISDLIQEVGFLPLGWNYNQKLDKELKKQQLELEDQELAKSQEIIDILKSNQTICTKKEEDSKSKYNWQECLESLSRDLKEKPTLVSSLPVDFKEQIRTLDKLIIQEKFPTTYSAFNNTLTQKTEGIRAKKNMEVFNDSSKQDNLWRELTGLNKNDWIRQAQSWWVNTKTSIKNQGGWFNVFFGWLVSALAIAMGAPFWFDILRKIMNFRSTGQEIVNKNRIKKIG
jgi:hypothetical protein